MTHCLSPYYCVVEKVCLKCENHKFEVVDESSGKVKSIKCCGERRYVFCGDNALDEFLEFMFSQNN